MRAAAVCWLCLFSRNQRTSLVNDLVSLSKAQVGKLQHRQSNVLYTLIRKLAVVSELDTAG